ncbi:hypothetical protein O9K51_04169 [Purpureocillium lavendulum]|uniref:Uncharacterized protein n=1 Tax=Purpureocillium lavendulum TaxID=1247861 RepID=A0AB34FUK4_9HYPO|nr:hypothetical protein O9K51_04169 [Purpureocillium lavendulum]
MPTAIHTHADHKRPHLKGKIAFALGVLNSLSNHQLVVFIPPSPPASNMCVWVTTQYYTGCGCSIEERTQHPGCTCQTVVPQVGQTWDGHCPSAGCPNPKK